MSDDPTRTDTGQAYLLGEINANVQHLLVAFKKHGEDTDRRLNGHADRISTLEKQSWKIIGIASVLPVAISVAGLALALLT